MVIDLKRSIGQRRLLMPGAIFISDDFVFVGEQEYFCGGQLYLCPFSATLPVSSVCWSIYRGTVMSFNIRVSNSWVFYYSKILPPYHRLLLQRITFIVLSMGPSESKGSSAGSSQGSSASNGRNTNAPKNSGYTRQTNTPRVDKPKVVFNGRGRWR